MASTAPTTLSEQLVFSQSLLGSISKLLKEGRGEGTNFSTSMALDAELQHLKEQWERSCKDNLLCRLHPPGRDKTGLTCSATNCLVYPRATYLSAPRKAEWCVGPKDEIWPHIAQVQRTQPFGGRKEENKATRDTHRPSISTYC